MARALEEECFELFVGLRVDADACVPFWGAAALRCYAGSTVADGISLEFDRISTAVTNAVAFFLLEWMMPLGDKQQEPVSVSDVLHVRQATFLPVGTLTLADINFVLGYQLAINCITVFAFRDPSGHVPPVAVPQIADGDLLNESFG
jgi:hypothetical protein